MLNLYAGRENIDKEAFIYDRIAEDGGETFVLVPNQYTLVAEEQALKYLDTDCLFDVEILSMNRLGLRLLTEQGIESVPMLDKYGRFMLLTRLIREHMDDFDIFRRSAGRMTFTAMLNDFISEFKQQNCKVESIEEMLGKGTEDKAGKADPLLRAKLEELELVVRAYEEAIAGKYTDSEDYIASYVDAIKSSEMIRDKSIWIYGYDSITPKFTDAMLELATVCRSVNFVVNRSDFSLDEQMIAMLYARCGEKEWKERGLMIRLEEISPAYELPRSETIKRIEQGLWNRQLADGERADNSEFVPEDLTLVRAVDPYAEAETAAAYIWHLVRDLGYRMSDIQVIANDEGAMQPVIRRVFGEYGLPVFADSVRDITDTPAVSFIVNLLWFTLYRGSAQYLFAMLKTGLSPYDDGSIEDLENYVSAYHIKGSMWDRDFKYGEENIGSEKFAALNEMRADIMKRIAPLDDMCRGKQTGDRAASSVAGEAGNATAEATSSVLNSNDMNAVSEVTVVAQSEAETAYNGSVSGFVKWFRAYLTETWQLDQMVEDAANADEEAGLHDEAQRLVQSYNKALELLGQIDGIMGDSELELSDFTDIYVTGLTGVEVGVIPPTADGLSMGTMIRTRPRPVRAAVILGANEGTLPLSPSTEGLFSVDEKAWFREAGFPLGVLDDIKVNEENAAMYRMMAKPSEKLYMSWSMTDVNGGEAAPSALIESLRTLFPKIDEEGLILDDIVTAGWDNAGSITGTACGGMHGVHAEEASDHKGVHGAHDERAESAAVKTGDLFNMAGESLRHLTEHIKDGNVTSYSDPRTRALLKWFDINRHEELQSMLRAAADDNEPRPLEGGIPAALFGRRDGSLVLSASSINSYFECPFKFYIDRGLRPREERDFRSDPRAIGDAYHECLMAVARRLMGRDRSLLEKIRTIEEGNHAGMNLDVGSDAGITGPTDGSINSISSNISDDINCKGTAADDEIERLVSEELEKIAVSYNGGLFISAGSEQFRMSRIKEICSAAAKAMAQQLAAESLEGAEFEESFRRGGRFSPISFELDGTKVFVEGKIDRADFLTVRGGAGAAQPADGGAAITQPADGSADDTAHSADGSAASNRIRVIDYKTGSDKLDVWKMRNGYKMQLMIYMISATSGGLEPAGIFYFNIKDPIESADRKSEKQMAAIKEADAADAYKLKGSYIDEPGVLGAMPEKVLAGTSRSKRSMTREEYEELRHDVLSRIEETASGILSGSIRIRPFKDDKKLVCNYCSYRSICRRDREYVRNSGRELPPEPKPAKP